MSDSKAGAAAHGANGAAEGAESAGPKPSKLPLLLGLLNTVAVLAAVGALVYTRVLFKRPPITEASERANIEAMKVAKPAKAVVPGEVAFDQTTINIASSPMEPKPTESSNVGGSNPAQLGGKMHYATVAFTLEIRDADKKADIEALKPLITDQFLTLMGRKQFHELTSVQGRYVLKTQVIELANELWAKRQNLDAATANSPADPIVTELYFSQFIVQ
jgi:flagellar basal body-associated protein FliL